MFSFAKADANRSLTVGKTKKVFVTFEAVKKCLTFS
jgi:hypothetical protein